MSNQVPDITALFDQFTTTLENFAVLLKVYHKKLLDEGFSRSMANQLTKEFQNTYWQTTLGVFKPNKDD
jgi:hypothetical protein